MLISGDYCKLHPNVLLPESGMNFGFVYCFIAHIHFWIGLLI